MVKKCGKCPETSPEAFNLDRTRRDGLQYRCKQCEKKYRQLNRLRIEQYMRVYHFNTYESRKSVIKKANKNWQILNRAKACYLARNYVLAKIKRSPSWLTELDLEHIQMFYIIAMQLTAEIGIKFVVDHIIPLNGKNVSGLHVPNNLQIITAIDNMKKSNKWSI